MRQFFFTSVLVSLAISAPAYAQFFGKEKPAVTVTKEAPAPSLAPGGAPQSFADLSEKLLPSVVNISSSQKMDQAAEDMPELPEFPPGSPFEQFFKDFMEKKQQQQQQEGLPQDEGGDEEPALASLGSGFIIDAEKGLIVTNNHVIRDADEVRVTLHDDTTLDAKILGKDDKMDLALLQVVPGSHKLTAVPFGNSDTMRVGDWVVAIGNPFGLGGTVTTGIISARARDIQAGPYDDFIQTDASINRGNSGGPMFNLNGEVIGINTAIFSPTGGSVGIGFAIPSNLAKPVVDQLIKYGKTKRGWLGIKIQTVTPEIADSLGLKESGGALIANITPNGPAEKAKLQQGDIILEFNGQKLSGMRQLPRMVAETAIGSDVDIVFWRDGKTMTSKIMVGELEKAEEEGLVQNATPTEKSLAGTFVPAIGFTISDLNDTTREGFDIPETATGVLVTAVKASSEAGVKGMMVGDIIAEINQQQVKDVKQAQQLIEDAQKAGKASVLLLVDHQGKGDVRFVALRFKAPLENKKLEQPVKPEPTTP